MSRFIFFFLCLSFSLHGLAQIKIPSIFSNHMVLQRNKPIPIWGKAASNSIISIHFRENTLQTKTTENGDWKFFLPASKAGGPYTLKITNTNSTVTFTDVLIGDVWVASGQSNMEFKVKQADKAKETLTQSHNTRLRLFQVPHQVSFEKTATITNTKWVVSDSTNIKNFSAVAYNFGKRLNQEESIPIGIIESTWGGTPVEAWTSPEILQSSPLTQKKVAKNKDLGIADLQQDSIRLKKFWDIVFNPKKGLDTIIPKNSYSTSNWRTVNVPGTIKEWENEDYEGILWLKKRFFLKKSKTTELEINLGHPEMNYSVYVNGKEIAKNIWNVAPNHHYTVKNDFLNDGKNEITLRLAALWGGGGFLPPEKDMYIKYNNKKSALAGKWKYKKDLEPKIPFIKNYHQYPAVLYNGMISPIASYGITGFIWYQGENNEDNAYNYRTLFPMMITDWRINWKQGYLPFLFVQLPNYRQPQEQAIQDEKWAVLRESQSKALQLSNTGMVTTLGLGETDDIHPTAKIPVAKRLANLALSMVYHHKNIVGKSPELAGFNIKDNTIILNFKNVGNGLTLRDSKKEITGFAIAGTDKKFVWAKAEIIGENKIKVFSEKVKNPVAVRYAWANNPEFSIINSENMPLSTFRTDTWKVITEK